MGADRTLGWGCGLGSLFRDVPGSANFARRAAPAAECMRPGVRGPNVFRLPRGTRAPLTSDRVEVTFYPGGRHGWSGVVSLGDDAAFALSEPKARSFADAEAEAIAWAEACGSRYLAVECAEGRKRSH